MDTNKKKFFVFVCRRLFMCHHVEALLHKPKLVCVYGPREIKLHFGVEDSDKNSVVWETPISVISPQIFHGIFHRSFRYPKYSCFSARNSDVENWSAIRSCWKCLLLYRWNASYVVVTFYSIARRKEEKKKKSSSSSAHRSSDTPKRNKFKSPHHAVYAFSPLHVCITKHFGTFQFGFFGLVRWTSLARLCLWKLSVAVESCCWSSGFIFFFLALSLAYTHRRKKSFILVVRQQRCFWSVPPLGSDEFRWTRFSIHNSQHVECVKAHKCENYIKSFRFVVFFSLMKMLFRAVWEGFVEKAFARCDFIHLTFYDWRLLKS